MAQFRLGVAPIKLETGRYEQIPVNSRLCIGFNSSSVEDELHVLLHCDLYTDIRHYLFQYIVNINVDFVLLSDDEKFCFILSNPDVCFYSAKTLNSI